MPARGARRTSRSSTRAARAELYGNEINDELVVRPGGHLVTRPDRRSTAHVVDGVVEGGAARGRRHSARSLRLAQTGFVRSYALSAARRRRCSSSLALLAVNLA